MKILIVEDEKRLALALSDILKQEKYETECVYDGALANFAIENGNFDAVILDIMLPNKNGLEILKDVRKAKISVPILLLTAKSELDDKVKGLDFGADDYLTKPFMSKELLARLRALLRRNSDIKDENLSYNDIVLDKNKALLLCTTTNLSVRLSEKEFYLLEYFLSNSNKILTREQIALKIWGFDSEAEYNNVEVYLTFTRKKLSLVGSKTEIKAIRGIGYELKS